MMAQEVGSLEIGYPLDLRIQGMLSSWLSLLGDKEEASSEVGNPCQNGDEVAHDSRGK